MPGLQSDKAIINYTFLFAVLTVVDDEVDGDEYCKKNSAFCSVEVVKKHVLYKCPQ